MRIGVLAPISWRVPPRHYGPWELFASLLTEGLVARGHDVTLFATGDSVTAARLNSVVARSWSEDPEVDPKVAECLHISNAFEQAAEFDIIHNSFDFLPLTYAALVDTPTVTTIHGFSSPRIVPVYARYNARSAYVAISDADRHPDLDYVATIHHGINVDDFELHESDEGYLAFFGRIHPDKGVVEAIDAAQKADLPLRIAGIIHDQDYFDGQVLPRIDGTKVQYIGPVRAEDRSTFLGGAVALLHLIDFEEPFGFSVVEAMACGTPVIAFDRGSMRELIEEGVTGAVVPDVSAAADSVASVATLDRSAIRAVAVERFSHHRMVDDYLKVYERVLGTSSRSRSPASRPGRAEGARRPLRTTSALF
jgi:glycosyltransferase involved in cell wall biosynthesis